MAVGGDDDTVAGNSAPTTLDGASGKVGETGELVAGRYRVVRWLGGGGMGRVYEALDTELDERVALKVLSSNLNEEAIERFRREVKLTRRIVHRNVARMFDIGEHAGERFLTMELVDGEPLSRTVRPPVPWPQLRSITEQLCAGLAAAHEAGVVHRDLKPDNVLVERGSGRIVITDFGIARSGDDPGVTQVGAVVGTPRYMAPEQLASRQVDARADVFSLGVMLFELATGTRPWSGDSAIAIAVAHATEQRAAFVTESGDIPAVFGTIVGACLHIEPERRPARVELVAQAIASGSADGLGVAAATRVDRPSKPAIAAPPARPRSASEMRAPTTQVAPTTVAVLPVTCAPGDEYLADGVQEELTDLLSTVAGLRVRPPGIARGQAQDPRELGRQLAVEHVVVASLRRTAGRLRVSARLISVADGFQIWAHRTDCS
ncbi:MAG TPA: serine/threonine-protein kinase, partial [Kofleriaceae bacterium]|nr:serine/threonine-protein kinase [Kofleriaceae bacterium]